MTTTLSYSQKISVIMPKRSFDISTYGSNFKKLCTSLDVVPTVEDAHRLFQNSSFDAVNDERADDDYYCPSYSNTGEPCVLYCLKLAGDKYYVGRSKDHSSLMKRIELHKIGRATEWTTLYKYDSLHFIKYDKNFYDEDSETISMMASKGITNVRGGTFSQVVLPTYHSQTIKDMINTGKNTCFACGQPGHYAHACALRK
jgi:hypothetical protein